MPKTVTIEKTVFTYAELDDSGKDNAREWFASSIESDDFDSVIEDFKIIADLIGVQLATRRGSSQAAIYWSGFYSLGDGACFEGRYSYRKGAAKAVREHAPKDSELHRIADELQQVQRRNFYRLCAHVEQSGRYMHSGCTRVHVYRSDYEYSDIPEDSEESIRQCMRDLMDWLYKQLDKENDYLTSAEHVAEMCEANEYEFDENGRIA